MEGLRSGDFQAVLDFVEAAWAFAGRDPFPRETLEALSRVVPCDTVGYTEIDHIGRRTLAYVGTDPVGPDEDELFWSIIDEHPLCRHQQAYADFSALRLSDVIDRRRLLASRVHAEWFRPVGIVAELEVGVARSRACTRNFVLDRTSGDFSVRDRAVLALVAPHLARIREMAALRRRAGAATPDDLERLTTREAEILELVAAGLTNAGIAERLWISPATVKKHLENVYEKLGVANRTAAAARVKAQGTRTG